MSQHIYRRFDEELNTARDLVLSMGGLVEKAIGKSVNSLLNGDVDAAREVIESDRAVNALEVQVDNMLRNTLARRQPAGRDLRMLVALMKVVTDLERMGDLSVSIARGTIEIQERPLKRFSNLEVMTEKVQRQVDRSLDAISRENVELAMQVIESDRSVDSLYKSMYREILTYMMEDARDISALIVLSNVAKNLERIADHATNVAEMVIYLVRGHDIRHVDHEAVNQLLKDARDTTEQN